MILFTEQILFWGLRECRSINLQAIQQADVTIECAGAKIARTITDVQRFPNFPSSMEEADKYKLLVVRSKNNFLLKTFDFDECLFLRLGFTE